MTSTARVGMARQPVCGHHPAILLAQCERGLDAEVGRPPRGLIEVDQDNRHRHDIAEFEQPDAVFLNNRFKKHWPELQRPQRTDHDRSAD